MADSIQGMLGGGAEVIGSVEGKAMLQGSVAGSWPIGGALTGLEKINGYSAYQIAVIHGFAGTEEEWLESLHGKDGTGAPEATAADDGKVLGVVNGAYALVTPKYPVVTQNGTVLTIE